MAKKTLGVTSNEDLKEKVSDVELAGVYDPWTLIAKASSESQGWMKSTKAMNMPQGVLIQVTTQNGDHVAEALAYVPNTTVMTVINKLNEQEPERKAYVKRTSATDD